MLLCAQVVLAQTITGRVIAKNDSAGIAAAIVSLLDSSGHVVAARLAEDKGDFAFAAPAAGRYAVRAERIGYRSSTSAPFLVRQNDTIDVPIAIVGDGVSLRAVMVNADRRCLVRPQEGLATARLWDEARKALSATEMTRMAQAASRARRDPHRFAVRMRKFSRDLDPRTLAALHEEAFELEGEAVTPFSSADPEILARDGYVAGDSKSMTTYYAPDAMILLSDRFLDSHCFRLQTAEDDRRAELIGLGFEPIHLTSEEHPDRTDVRGVLWLDQATAELRYMEYSYVSPRLQTTASRAGGLVEFRPLPDGRWIVWRWYIRMPQLVERRTGTDPLQPTAHRTEIAQVREEGAEVLSVMPAGTSRVNRATLHGVVHDSLRGMPIADARVFLSGTSFATLTSSDGSYVIESVPPGKYLASIVTPRLDSLLIEPPSDSLTLSAGENRRLDFGVPGLHALSRRLCNEAIADSLAVIVGVVHDTAATNALGARVRAEWQQFSKQGSDRLVSQPIVNETVAGPGGRYALCGVPASAHVTVHARRDHNVAKSPLPPLRPGEVRRLDLTLRAP
jgi:hypothetical protein